MPSRPPSTKSPRVARGKAAPALRSLKPTGQQPSPARRPARADEAERSTDPLALFAEALHTTWNWLDLEHLSGLNKEVAERMRRIPTQLNAYGYDPWGFNVDAARFALTVSTLVYRYYFRVVPYGMENIPTGRVLIIANHAGQIALDAAMVATAAFLEIEPPRIVRGMGEYWLPTVPFVNELMARTGSVVGTPKNCIDLLRNDEAVIAFPEGVRGMNKLFRQRYRLQRFGLGFMRLALATGTPIVPVAVIGSEEQAPGIANLRPLGRLLGMPAFPITLTWPWLGPLGLIPLPVKYRIHFGAPLRFAGDPDDDDAIIEKKVDKVKDTIQSMLDRGVRERRGVFV